MSNIFPKSSHARKKPTSTTIVLVVETIIMIIMMTVMITTKRIKLEMMNIILLMQVPVIMYKWVPIRWQARPRHDCRGENKGRWGGGCSSVGTASDRHAAKVGSSPRCGKGIFSQSQLSVQTLLRCPHIPKSNRMHQHLCAR